MENETLIERNCMCHPCMPHSTFDYVYLMSHSTFDYVYLMPRSIFDYVYLQENMGYYIV